MIEIKIKLDEIDYADVVKLTFPLLKKEAQNNNSLWASVIRNMEQPNEEIIRNVLKLIPEGTKEQIAIKLVEKNKSSIINALTSYVSSKDIDLRISELDISSDKEK